MQHGVTIHLLGEDVCTQIQTVCVTFYLQQVGQIQLIGILIFTKLALCEVHHSVDCWRIHCALITELPGEGV